MKGVKEQQIQEAWGTTAEYYQELETFMKQHEGASYIERDTEVNSPIRAVYYFRPYVTYMEREQLLRDLEESGGA